MHEPGFVVRQVLGYFPQQSALALGASPELLQAPGARLQLHSFSAANARQEMQMRAAALSAATAATGSSAAGGLLVSCLGRGEALYGERGVETGLLRGELGHDLPLAGFFAGGEVGPVGQRTFVHTYTCTAAILRATKSPTATSSPAS